MNIVILRQFLYDSFLILLLWRGNSWHSMDGKDWWKNSTTERDTHCNVSNYAEVLQYSLQALPYWERDT